MKNVFILARFGHLLQILSKVVVLEIVANSSKHPFLHNTISIEVQEIFKRQLAIFVAIKGQNCINSAVSNLTVLLS